MVLEECFVFAQNRTETYLSEVVLLLGYRRW